MKIKITVPTTEEKEIEIELPHYSKKGNDFYAVVKEEKDPEASAVNVWISTSKEKAQISNINEFDKATSSEPCTAEEFLAAFEQAKSILISKAIA